jgi:formate hydrogenlyase subunit 6/NADH:ubiquinone oxidoreductase subunit I
MANQEAISGKSMTRYAIDQKKCTFCGGCSAVCPQRAVMVLDSESRITGTCNNCGQCERFCPVSAIYIT